MRRRVIAIGLSGALLGLASCGQETPEGAESITDYSRVGDCLRPDRGRAERFLQAACDDPEATVEIVEMVSDQGVSSSPLCPPGTDLLVDGAQGPVDDGEIAAVAQTWCLRKLEAPHPGDPGKGGGELHPEDCFAVDAAGAIDEQPCDGSGTAGTASLHRLLAVEERVDDCPMATSDPIELDGFPPRVLCAAPV